MTTTKPLPADDPTATYRGYRRQSLYALSRVFDDTLPTGVRVQPEGVEDVAIFGQDGSPIEIVQVKDHTANLAASSFKPIFYQRISSYCKPGSTTAVTIATYGPVGPDLSTAVSGDGAIRERVVERIAKKGVKKKQALAIIKHINIQEVSEEDLVHRLIDILKQTVTGTDPAAALDFLVWWMLTSSEDQRLIDRSDAIAKINNIGRFIAKRAAYHDEWHTSIVPLADWEGSIDKSKLSEEFYRGGRVRFDHIATDIDVPRGRFLSKIHESFDRSNVVVLHSASGQGKTSIAYRYLKEFAPSEFRFEALRADSLSHARKMALALTGHSSAVDVPTLVFVDVSPGDLGWVELVKGLSAADGIRVLVAIREEDWRRSNVTVADFTYQEVELAFGEDEAKAIYGVLPKDQSPERHLDFEDAWSQFGDRKTLIEFVYYVTQNESLSQRVQAQAKTICDEARAGERSEGEVDLLRTIAVATAFEARLDLARLFKDYDIPQPKRTLELFEKEYLIRVSDDHRYVEQFHAIRSEILCDELCDTVITPWSEVAAACLPLLVEKDLERFLLCAFSRRPAAVMNLVTALDEFQPITWLGVCGILRALLWDGLRNYVDENMHLIKEIYKKKGSAWQIMLDWDLAQVRGENGLIDIESLTKLSPDAGADAHDIRKRQSDKQRVFEPIRKWLSCRREKPGLPSDSNDWMAMAEVMFWVGHLDIETSLRDGLPKDDVISAIRELPVHRFGNFIRGIRECHPDWYAQWLSQHRGELEERIRREASIVNLANNADSIVAHYIIDLDQNASVLRRNAQGDAVFGASVHEITIERVCLLNAIFPGKETYGAVGCGHRNSFLKHEHDNANKPGVLAENLLPVWTPRFDALARGLAERRLRADTWGDFQNRLKTIRETVIHCLSDLKSTLSSTRQKEEKATPLLLENAEKWDFCLGLIREGILLPQSSVDEWGYVIESLAQPTEDQILTSRYTAVTRTADLRKAIEEYCRTLQNFMSQALQSLILLPPLREATNDDQRKRVLDVASQNGISEDSVRFSMLNGCDACKAVQALQLECACFPAAVGDPASATSFAVQESRAFSQTIDAWCRFVSHPSHRPAATKRNRKGQKVKVPVPFAWALIPVRTKIKAQLHSLKKENIRARILSEKLEWDGKPALWISIDVDHPCALPAALERVWQALQAGFTPFRFQAPESFIIGLLWQQIVIVPLVKGRSLEQQCCPHFGGTIFETNTSLEDKAWHFLPEVIPADTWISLGLQRWPLPREVSLLEQSVADYALLLRHVGHMSDLTRFESEIDELGMEILQDYLAREAERVQPVLQTVFDSLAAVLDVLNSVPRESLAERPNLVASLGALIELGKALPPTPDFHNEAALTLYKVCEWRDRLLSGMQDIGAARLFLFADSLGSPEFQDI